MEIIGLNPQIARSLETVSSKIGIVNAFRKAHLQHSDPNVVAYSATTADAGVLTDSFKHLAGGAGVTWKDAFLATIGEAVERYGSSFYDLKRLVKAKASDFDAADIVAPETYALFADQQYDKEGFPFVRFTADTELYWDTAVDLVDGRTKYVPAIFLYMPFRADAKPIAEQISTGFAVHSEPERALLSSIFEVIERDAFMISWMNLLDLPKIRIDGELKAFANAIVPPHLDLHLLDMTTDVGIPSVLGIMRGHHDFGEFIVVCASTRSDYFSAAKKTIIELCQSVPYFRNLLEMDKDYSDFSSVRTFVDHSLFYLHRKELWPVFDTWLNAKPTLSISPQPEVEPQVQLKRVTHAFRERGYSILVKDKTTVDLAQAGFHLVRAVCPGFVHLNGTFGSYYTGGERLYNVPVRTGRLSVPKTYETLNPLPHPFP
jgi:ribosomal protein S12 methylthiotransferase accessory factor